MKFYRAKNVDFFVTSDKLTADQEPTVDIEEMKLYVKLVTPNPQLQMQIDQQFLKTVNIQYPRFNCTRMSIQIKSNTVIPFIDYSSRPSMIFLGFQKPDCDKELTSMAHPDSLTLIQVISGNHIQISYVVRNSSVIKKIHQPSIEIYSEMVIQYLHLIFAIM
ncbi:hypothetical protein PAPYR_7538 [Paratrimastix pyriformis]|uniref:Uncharacterized protein n=1 Tax=Paratrimastix pyriformis TaxID=342808 RepID=A0ABQ8U938_9EUKA|nr:hypothetical protein PAPYR_11270 [Paratrimastix pyriformis]KAJ4457031.1 hypothetical protein PAPYR_7538 [Paratrimastix pyriformis]